MKKILLIAYHFPPSLAVGAKRVAALAKHLPLFGWEPHVLTIQDAFIKEKDKTSDPYPQGRIFKTAVYPTIRDAYLRVKNAVRGANRRESVSQENDKETENGNAPSNKWERVRVLLKNLKSIVLAFPDTERGWVMPAIPAAVRLVRKYKMECMLTSGPPHSSHVIGLVVKKITKVRWAMDLRDPIVTTREEELCSFFGDIYVDILKHLELLFFRNADIIITTTNNFNNYLIERNKHICNKNIYYVPNGYDIDKVKDLSNMSKYDKFTICYTGNLYMKRTPEIVFQAISELLAEGKIKIEDIVFKFVGDCSRVNSIPIESLINKYGLNAVVQISPPVSSSIALEVIARSHMALLIALEQPFQVPAKIFDYMVLGTPVIALTEKGATRDIIEETGIGKSFFVDEIDEIKSYILEIFDNRSIKVADNPNIQSYERVHLVSVMSSLLDANNINAI